MSPLVMNFAVSNAPSIHTDRAANDPNAEQSLEQLMTRYSQGDARAFDALFRRAHPKLLAALTRLTSDRSRAEDIAQVTFMKVHRARESYKPGSPVLPWLYVIAKRSLYDEQRPMSARYEVLSADGSLADADRAVEQADAESSALLQQVFTQLPPQYRDAIELTKLSGLSGNEAATALNTTKAAIKQRVHRGYALLRSWLEPSLETSLESDAAAAA